MSKIGSHVFWKVSQGSRILNLSYLSCPLLSERDIWTSYSRLVAEGGKGNWTHWIQMRGTGHKFPLLDSSRSFIWRHWKTPTQVQTHCSKQPHEVSVNFAYSPNSSIDTAHLVAVLPVPSSPPPPPYVCCWESQLPAVLHIVICLPFGTCKRFSAAAPVGNYYPTRLLANEAKDWGPTVLRDSITKLKARSFHAGKRLSIN